MAPRGLSSPAWPSPALAHRDVPLTLTPRSVIQPRSASLSSGAKAGVAVGSIAGFAILLCIAWPFFIAFKRKLQGKERYHPSDDVGPSQPRDLSVKSLDLEIQQPSQQPGEPKPDASRDGSDQTAVQSLQGHPIPPHYRIPWPPEQQQQQQQQPAPPPQRTQRDWTDWAAQKLRRLTAGRDPTARSPVDDFSSPFSPVTPTWGSHPAGPPSLQPAPVLKVTSSTSQGGTLGPFYPQPISPPLDRQLSPPGSPISPDSRFPNATLLSEVDGAANTGLPSPPIGFIEPGYDPKQLWNPTTQTEHQYSVNHELTKLETASATASPSPPPQPTTELLQPLAEPYLDPRTPPSQGIPSPQSHDLEMTDITSDFSSPAGPALTTASSRDTPETNFTHSEFNSMSPRSNMDSDLNYASPSGVPETPMIPEVAEDDGNDATSSPEDGPTSPRIYKCDECNKSFEQIHRLNHHKRYHERKHECTVPGCGKKFGTKTHLDRHINDKHKKTRKFYCTEPTCPYSIQGGKSFPRKDNWVRHIRKKHRNLSVSNLEAMGVAVDEEAGTLQGISGPSGMGQPAPQQMPLGPMATNTGMSRMAMNFGAPMDMTGHPMPGQPMPGGQYMPPQHMVPQHMGGQPGLAYGWNPNPMVKSEFP